VVSGDTLPQRKPHPAPLLLAASQLALPPASCLYVGDAERDVQSARAAGMPVLVARYGYLGPDDDPDSWQPDAHIDTPLQIIDWLDGVAAR
jgi:phosphoglycolate phosphatase